MSEHQNFAPLPSLEKQRENVRATGNQFSEAGTQDRWQDTPELVFATKEEGYKRLVIDSAVVPEVPYMVAPNQYLHAQLQKVRPEKQTDLDPSAWIEHLMKSEGLIIGFSGYGTGSSEDFKISYDKEHKAIDKLFDAFENGGQKVSQVVDGGGSFGLPAVASTAARERGYETTAISTVQGLRGIAPHENVVVTTGENLPEYENDVNGGFGTEAPALGATPDILVVMGGGLIAKQEIDAAMGNATDIIFAPGVNENYLASSAVHGHKDRKSLQANASGPLETRVHVVDSIDAISTIVGQLDLNKDRLQASRQIRAQRLKSLLH
ncbi:MAG TPA: hypothetical protein VH144_00070 [Candidatus Saccharimonadales bacterium]|jgi:hypothetical protein|nr:hypothetical protein [Candidatus Saccharimonadales bacterium]